MTKEEFFKLIEECWDMCEHDDQKVQGVVVGLYTKDDSNVLMKGHVNGLSLVSLAIEALKVVSPTDMELFEIMEFVKSQRNVKMRGAKKTIGFNQENNKQTDKDVS